MIKRICLLLALLLSIASLAIAEEAFDATQYSLEELMAIRAAIEEEINARVDTTTATLKPGNYVAGVDIAPGSYLLLGIQEEPRSQAYYFKSTDDLPYDDVDTNILNLDEEWRVTLTEGMVLTISDADCAIQKAPAMLFAPD